MTFAHVSERQVAELLDTYGVCWEYEPRLFDLPPKGGFRPDFYLPDWDVYVEVTTVRTPTRKNQKLRRMREHYPEVAVVILRKEDLRRVLESDSAGAAHAAILGLLEHDPGL